MTIVLTGDHGLTQYKAEDLPAGETIDATAAVFHATNNKKAGPVNPYPVAVRSSSGVTMLGGAVIGRIDQETDREIVYNYSPGNSASIRAEDAPDVTIRGWRIDACWDGVRVSDNCDGFLIEDVWISNARDDAIENDKLNSGAIRDCLFDGVMNGLSIDPSSSSPMSGEGKTVTLDGVLLRMKRWLSDGKVTHGTPIKVDKTLPMPELRIANSVFAIEEVEHNGLERLGIAWGKVIESAGNLFGNVFLNLSDTPLPDDYPMPPAGWTVMQGQAARAHWQIVRDAWVVAHAGMAIEGDTVPDVAPEPEPNPDPTPDPTPEPVTVSVTVSVGGVEKTATFEF